MTKDKNLSKPYDLFSAGLARQYHTLHKREAGDTSFQLERRGVQGLFAVVIHNP